jgi:F0F1-type ATP synthase delta subunit
MAIRISRRKITTYIADQFAKGGDKTKLIKQLAAFLIDNKRTNELDLILRDIEYQLLRRGIVLARVTSAFELAAETRVEITKMVKDKTHATTIELQQFIEPTLLGGVKLDLPGMQLDNTISRRLTTLRTNVKK